MGWGGWLGCWLGRGPKQLIPVACSGRSPRLTTPTNTLTHPCHPPTHHTVNTQMGENDTPPTAGGDGLNAKPPAHMKDPENDGRQDF